MTIEGISHITLIVQDLNRTSALLSSVLGAKEVYDSGEETFSLSKERFFLLAGIWVAIMQGNALSDRTYNHIAFKIPESEYENYRHRLENVKVEFREGRPRVEGEGMSLYFHDYDNHLFELHTGTLEERLETYGRKAGNKKSERLRKSSNIVVLKPEVAEVFPNEEAVNSALLSLIELAQKTTSPTKRSTGGAKRPRAG